jgi:drug/metabolite transporter (DMT)-like permease
MQRIGELAAFMTAICWTLGSLFFEQGVKRIGVIAVNFYKVFIGFILLTLTAAVMRGVPFPLDAPLRAWVFLPISGIVGFVIADMFLLSAYGTVGPRVTMLFMALSPLVTAGIAFIVLGETLGLKGFLGMSFVIIGICITVFGKQSGMHLSKMKKEDRKGYIFALVATVGNSVGLSLSKIGIGDYHPVSATQIRTFTAIIGFALVSFVFDRGAGIKNAHKNIHGLKFAAMGSVFGPFLGVTFSLLALQRTNAGVATSIIGLTPILIIIPELIILKRKIKPIEIIGAVIAVCGTIIFFL